MPDNTLVTVETGKLQGLEVDGLYYFRNIPFAAPPFGANRFLPPQPAENWDGVRDATRAGVAPPQPPQNESMPELYVIKEYGEDCLTLEVWTPDPGTSGLPVAVHIYGGGYVNGAGSLPGYSGRNFARDGVVHVGINYRVGIDGFIYLGEGHDNLGLRDQTAALQWVQRNIAAFGGDPARVTIFGQSGGGVSIMNQLAMPGSRGLFAQAIAQSGCSMPSVDADEAMRVTRQIAKGLHVAPTVEGFSGVSLADTQKAAYKALTRFAGVGLAFGDKRSLLLSPYRTVHGTEVVPANAFESAGTFPSVPLIAGTARNEMAPLINGIATALPLLAPFIRRGLKHALDMDRSVIDGYKNGPRHIEGLDGLVEAAWSDWGFRIPTIRLVEKRPESSWLYEFRWQPEGHPPNSASIHAIDLPFIRDDLQAIRDQGALSYPTFGQNPPESLAQDFHAAAVRFMTTGDPGWKKYDLADRATMVFNTPSSVENDAAHGERELWDGKR